MIEENNTFCPDYESFAFRAFGDLSQFGSFIAFLFWNIYSIINQVNWIFVILIDLILSANFTVLPIKYINYIGSLTINENQGTIKIILYRFDRIFKEFEIQIENTEVKIVDHLFYSRPINELRIYSEGKFICKQRETWNWTNESFKEIKKIILGAQKNIRQKNNLIK